LVYLKIYFKYNYVPPKFVYTIFIENHLYLNMLKKPAAQDNFQFLFIVFFYIWKLFPQRIYRCISKIDSFVHFQLILL